MRQVGVYHQHAPMGGKPGSSLWIFLHAKPNSAIQNRVESSVVTHNSVLQIHMIVLSTHLKSWRWYLHSLNTEFEKIVSLKQIVGFEEDTEIAV